MNKIVLCASCLALGAVAAFAEPSWAIVNTVGAKGETETGYPERYAAYLCTTEAAKTYFGGNSSYADVTDWLKVNYATGMSLLDRDKEATAMTRYGDGFDEGEYSFARQYRQDGSLADGAYIAVVACAGGAGEDDLFRVFESMASGGVLLFAPGETGGGTAGAWTAAAVPEPTSGMLFLLGLASLALRRKRGEG